MKRTVICALAPAAICRRNGADDLEVRRVAECDRADVERREAVIGDGDHRFVVEALLGVGRVVDVGEHQPLVGGAVVETGEPQILAEADRLHALDDEDVVVVVVVDAGVVHDPEEDVGDDVAVLVERLEDLDRMALLRAGYDDVAGGIEARIGRQPGHRDAEHLIAGPAVLNVGALVKVRVEKDVSLPLFGSRRWLSVPSWFQNVVPWPLLPGLWMPIVAPPVPWKAESWVILAEV